MKSNHLHFYCILLLFTNLSFTQAQTYVDANVSGGSQNGSSWSNAYPDLAVALSNAGAGEEFWVAQGSYYPTSSADKTISFTVSVQGVKIYGGFQSGQTSLAQRNWTTNPTILSGDINMDNDTLGNSFCVVSIGQNVTTLTLDGFIIQDGNANGQGGGGTLNGAAVNINAYSTPTGSAPSFNNCTFQNNFSKGQGGAIYVEAGNGGVAFPEFDRCTFQNNKAGSSGGAVYHSGYSNGNIATSFTNCDFLNNTAGSSGGAVFNHGGISGSTSPTFKQCNFDSNNAVGQHGGAMYNLGTNSGSSSPTITNCRFYNNSGNSAGGIYNNGTIGGVSSPTITNCTFVENFTINSGGNGGAIYANGSQSGTSNPVITNCIFFGNLTQNTNKSEIIRSVDGAPVFSYCFVDVTSCLELQSGPNITCGSGMIYDQNSPFTNLASGDLTLPSSSSAAVDKGLNSANSEPLDLIGTDRVSNTTIDLGAYEFENVGSLPIELISFRADYQQDKVKLTWVTANEINNEYFTIQHSVDGINFRDVEDINGTGNSTSIQSYFTFHKEPMRGINYYRLKQTDFDGTSSLSNIEAVRIFDGKINAFPNPVINEINISFADFEKGAINFAIYNIYGKEIFSQQVDIDNRLQVINLNEVGSFLPGTYFIKIFNSPNGTYVHKFQKVVD
ncbi:MAG: T9SS type A sorting domain-containing protein [Saprospiraceae bacterium]